INGVLRWTKEDVVQLAQLGKPDPIQPKVGFAAPEEDIIKAHKDRVIIEEQKMTQAVDQALRQARRDLQEDPDSALELLRNTLVLVREHPDLGDRVREALISRLQTALRDVATQGRTVKLKKQEQQLIVAQIKKTLDLQEQRK